MQQEPTTRRKMSSARRQTLIARLIVGLFLGGLMVGLAYWLVGSSDSKNEDIPILELSDKDVPIKVKPDASDNPAVPHKDKLIYREFSATPSAASDADLAGHAQSTGAIENILELPEEPQSILPEPVPVPHDDYTPEDPLAPDQTPTIDPLIQQEMPILSPNESKIPESIEAVQEMPPVIEEPVQKEEAPVIKKKIPAILKQEVQKPKEIASKPQAPKPLTLRPQVVATPKPQATKTTSMPKSAPTSTAESSLGALY